jgi:hypothetical protein
MVVVRNLLEYVWYAKCRVELAVALSRRPLPLESGWEPWMGPSTDKRIVGGGSEVTWWLVK